MLDSSAVQHEVTREKDHHEQAREHAKGDDYAAGWVAPRAQQRRGDDDGQDDEEEGDPSVRHIADDPAGPYELVHVEHVWTNGFKIVRPRSN